MAIDPGRRPRSSTSTVARACRWHREPPQRLQPAQPSRAAVHPARDGVRAPQQPFGAFQVPARSTGGATAGHARAIHLQGVDLDQLPAVTRRHASDRVEGPLSVTPERRLGGHHEADQVLDPDASRSRNSSAVCDRKASSKCWTTTTSAPASAIRAIFSSGSQIRSGARPVHDGLGMRLEGDGDGRRFALQREDVQRPEHPDVTQVHPIEHAHGGHEPRAGRDGIDVVEQPDHASAGRGGPGRGRRFQEHLLRMQAPAIDARHGSQPAVGRQHTDNPDGPGSGNVSPRRRDDLAAGQAGEASASTRTSG